MNPYERMVTLIDGRVVSNYSEEWRAECEARSVCRMPGKGARWKHIDAVKARRGEVAAEELRKLVSRIWDAEFRRG